MRRRHPRSSRSVTRRRAQLAGVVVAAGVLLLISPGLATAATTHHSSTGGGLFVPPTGGILSFFTSIFSGVAGFFSGVVKGIFGAFMKALLGSDFKFVEHPELIIEYLVSLPDVSQITGYHLTPEGVLSGTQASTAFTALTSETQGAGITLLGVSFLTASLRLVGSGLFTRPTDHLYDFGRIITTAVIILAWPWLFSQAVAFTNIIVDGLISAANVDGNLGKTAGAYITAAVAGGGADLLTDFLVMGMIGVVLGMIAIKIMVLVLFGILFVAGPLALAFLPFGALSRIVGLFISLFIAVALIPIGWSIIFDCFAAFGATATAGASAVGIGDTVLNALASFVCFLLALWWPKIIIGRTSGLIGGQVAEAGAAFNALTSTNRGRASASTNPQEMSGRMAAARAALGAASGTLGHGVGRAASVIPGYGAVPRATSALGRGAAKAGGAVEQGGLSSTLKSGGASGWDAVKQGGRNFNTARQNPNAAARTLAGAAASALQDKRATLAGAVSGTTPAMATAARVAAGAALAPQLTGNPRGSGPTAEQQGLDAGRGKLDSRIAGIQAAAGAQTPHGRPAPKPPIYATRTGLSMDSLPVHGPARAPIAAGAGSTTAAGSTTGSGASSHRSSSQTGSPAAAPADSSAQQRMSFNSPQPSSAGDARTASRTPTPAGSASSPVSAAAARAATSSTASAAPRPTPAPQPAAAAPASTHQPSSTSHGPAVKTDARVSNGGTPPPPAPTPTSNGTSEPIDTRSTLT